MVTLNVVEAKPNAFLLARGTKYIEGEIEKNESNKWGRG